MWIMFGVIAIVFAILNVLATLKKKKATLYRFISLSSTALTLCAFYADGARRIVSNDLSGLMDTMPTMSGFLWLCTLLAILINSVSLFKGNK